ncbi:hypothetical protein COU62_01015 [Candidatus Pacearchaeota archaeon CG10_big_fil_rev_8_21_14_0_10_35_219]|nr:hypothetical protein [Candidatus Pacearchaeota archaeon]OIO43018.1 MAG: hypothetical protein AUJ63_01185 [Candidatus Pacearchaeota archaeon CG1_02_35_32]PIO08144.1 MAG: hypothetical protein COU62_01015 [Candidatus Pacearchaeota archaeon CG10_big_fil_rev_8_21_14_0_10_35_219]PIY81078.1 MAG: hypothetical protein COY79_04725 [Candidatus Pacearchaeota archaeon CG_4_10_14_0_8_um_filter_35_169]PIZ79950.1 MAG: hypothetical protein COY00_03030 [Candidatus Pacearchaeota archaeon CG_4_10_14_0_2_um_filt
MVVGKCVNKIARQYRDEIYGSDKNDFSRDIHYLAASFARFHGLELEDEKAIGLETNKYVQLGCNILL